MDYGIETIRYATYMNDTNRSYYFFYENLKN